MKYLLQKRNMSTVAMPVNERPREELPIYKDPRYIKLVKSYKCKVSLNFIPQQCIPSILMLTFCPFSSWQTKYKSKETIMLGWLLSFFRKSISKNKKQKKSPQCWHQNFWLVVYVAFIEQSRHHCMWSQLQCNYQFSHIWRSTAMSSQSN